MIPASRRVAPRTRMLHAAAAVAILAGFTAGCAAPSLYNGPPIPTAQLQPKERVGTLARDSAVVIVYGDNRPGLHVMTASYGWPILFTAISTNTFSYWMRGLLNVPIAILQLFLPKLDGFRDLWGEFVAHQPTGGNEPGVLRAITANENMDLIVNTGDIVEDGRYGNQWKRFAEISAPLRSRVPFLASVGNHERTWHENGLENWNRVMGKPPGEKRYWYDVALGDNVARFIVLDTNILGDPKDNYPSDIEDPLSVEMLVWADSALKLPAKYKFIVIHHPLISSGHHFSDWVQSEADTAKYEEWRRLRLFSLARKHKVTAVLAGHEHLYQRVYITDRDTANGFWHVTTGGGGSPLYRIDKTDRLEATTVKFRDGSRVAWPGPEHTIYNYCRLVLRSTPGNQMGAELRVYDVRKNGSQKLVDRIDLSKRFDPPPPPPEVKKEIDEEKGT